jgi:CBS domain-containing protein
MPAVSEHMARELLVVERELPLEQAAKRMVERSVGTVLVLEGERLVGILTERDVLRSVAAGVAADDTVARWMTRGPETIGPSETTEQAAMLMIHGGFRHLPVVDEGGRVLGMLSIRDLVRLTLADAAPRGA